MKRVFCIALTILFTGCGRAPEKLQGGESNVQVAEPARSSDATTAVVTSELDPRITLDPEGGIQLPNLFNPQWQGRSLLGNQKLSLIAVE